MMHLSKKPYCMFFLLCSAVSTVATYAAEAGPAAAEVKADDSHAVEENQRPFFIARINDATREHTANVDRIAKQLNLTDSERFLRSYNPYAVRAVENEGEAIEYYYESFLTVAMRVFSTVDDAPDVIRNLIGYRAWHKHRYEKLSPLYVALTPVPGRAIPERSSLVLAEILVSNLVLAQSINIPCRLPNDATETPFGRIMRRFLQHGEKGLLKRIGVKADVNRPHIDGLFPLEYVVLPARTKRDVIFRAQIKDNEHFTNRIGLLAGFLAEQGAKNIITTHEATTQSCFDFAPPDMRSYLTQGWQNYCTNNNIDNPDSVTGAVTKGSIAPPPITYVDGTNPPGVEVSRTPAA